MKWPRKRFLIPVIIGILLALLTADFHRWVHRVADASAPVLPRADAVVALTGGSGKRIETAIKLLEGGAGERLLVSGVHESVNVVDLIQTAGGSEALYACCIDIGHQAHSTQGNALETRQWVTDKGYTSIVLVTSDYHMQRARLWFRHYAPEIKIIAFPMQSRISARHWWSSWKSFRGLVTEWAKYRVTAVILAF